MALHLAAPPGVRRQSGILVRLLTPLFGAITLAVKSDHPVDRIGQVGHQDPLWVPAGFEPLVPLGLLRFHFRAGVFRAQSQEPIGLAHPLRLITEFAFLTASVLGDGCRTAWPSSSLHREV
jgi:hypothetical protein